MTTIDRPPARPLLLLEAYGPGLTGDPAALDELRTVLAGSSIELVGMVVIPGDESVLLLASGDLEHAGPVVEQGGLTPIRIVEVRWYEG